MQIHEAYFAVHLVQNRWQVTLKVYDDPSIHIPLYNGGNGLMDKNGEGEVYLDWSEQIANPDDNLRLFQLHRPWDYKDLIAKFPTHGIACNVKIRPKSCCVYCGTDHEANVCPVCGLGAITGSHDAFVAFCDAEAKASKSNRPVQVATAIVLVVLVLSLVGYFYG